MSERAAGSIYDLGYRRYEGVRLGHRHAVISLYVHGLRAAFGLGRRTRSKIFPFGLAIIVAIPALFQVAAGAVAGGNVDVGVAEDYYGYIQIILVLFAAVVAPELLGRDQRHQILPLYFSRAISRLDYTLVRYAAMATALLCLTLFPQTVMFVGNALVREDFGEWGDVAPIILSGALVSIVIASIAMTIAAQSSRRSFATIGIVVPFILLTPLAALLVNSFDSLVGRLGVFLSPFHVMSGFTYWFFNSADPAGDLQLADFPGVIYALVALFVSAIGITLLARRYQRLGL